MHQLGHHSTPNHLMQSFHKYKWYKLCKLKVGFKCIRGLPWSTRISGLESVPQISNPTSTSDCPSLGTFLITLTSSFTRTTRYDNVCLTCWSTKHDAWWMHNKINNLSTTFLYGTVASQQNPPTLTSRVSTRFTSHEMSLRFANHMLNRSSNNKIECQGHHVLMTKVNNQTQSQAKTLNH
jgi:hypothetical protein